LELTAKEFELLHLLIANKGQTLGKELIFSRIWGADSESEPQTLTVHIKWLRRKIENDPKAPEKIITVWGKGYRWEG
jgi:DNA-binding response OmpR family regulator